MKKRKGQPITINELIRARQGHRAQTAEAAKRISPMTTPRKATPSSMVGHHGDKLIESSKGVGTRIMDMVTGHGDSQEAARQKARKISERAAARRRRKRK